MKPKHLLLSKTFWAAALIASAPLIPAVQAWAVQQGKWYSIAIAVLMIALRLVTSEPVRITKDG